MKTRSLFPLAVCSTLLALVPARSASEVTVRIPASYRTWDFSDSLISVTASQWAAPVFFSAALGDNVHLLMQAGAQSGSLDAAETSSLSGATDAKAALQVQLAGRRLLLQAGVNIPTGRRELDAEQQRVAFALSPPFLGYRIRQAGRGLDVGGGMSWAVPLGDRWALGLGGSYLHRGSFRALKGGEEIRPGGEITASAGFDGEIAGMSVRADANRRIYGADVGAGTDYKEPAVWEGLLSTGATGRGWGFDGALLLSHKEKGESGASPYSGNYLGGSLEIRRALGSMLWIGVGGEVVRFRSVDMGGETFDSLTGGVGPSLVLSLGDRTRIEGRLKRLKGTLDPGIGDGKSIEGWDAMIALDIAGDSQDR